MGFVLLFCSIFPQITANYSEPKRLKKNKKHPALWLWLFLSYGCYCVFSVDVSQAYVFLHHTVQMLMLTSYLEPLFLISHSSSLHISFFLCFLPFSCELNSGPKLHKTFSLSLSLSVQHLPDLETGFCNYK